MNLPCILFMKKMVKSFDKSKYLSRYAYFINVKKRIYIVMFIHRLFLICTDFIICLYLKDNIFIFLYIIHKKNNRFLGYLLFNVHEFWVIYMFSEKCL